MIWIWWVLKKKMMMMMMMRMMMIFHLPLFLAVLPNQDHK
jgi:hypothetical protein